MRPLRYFINVSLDGCCDHLEGPADEMSHRYATEKLAQADALIFGRVTDELMSFWRSPPPEGWPDWMKPFARTINEAKKYVVSNTLKQDDWNSELVRGDLGKFVRELKQKPGQGHAHGRLEARRPERVRVGSRGVAI